MAHTARSEVIRTSGSVRLELDDGVQDLTGIRKINVGSGLTLTDDGVGEAGLDASGTSGYDGAVLNDRGNAINQSVASSVAVIVETAHTVVDTGGYVSSTHLGVPTLEIPAGGHGLFRVSAGAYLGPNATTPPTSGYFLQVLAVHSSGDHGDGMVSGFPYTDLGALTLHKLVAWTQDMFLDDGAYLEWYFFNVTNQTMQIFHSVATSVPKNWLSIQRLNSQSSP